MTDLEWLARNYRWPESDADATCAVISLSTGARVWILLPQRTSGYTRQQWLAERQRIASVRGPKTLEDYRATKSAMEAIISRHMESAFRQIDRELGDTPTRMNLQVDREQHALGCYPSCNYLSCRVNLDGD